MLCSHQEPDLFLIFRARNILSHLWNTVLFKSWKSQTENQNVKKYDTI